MTNIRTLVSVSTLVAAFVGFGPGAMAQTAHKSVQLAQVKPAAAASTWKCSFSVVELAPVSQDTSGRPTAWVMVHRVNGEIVASERVSQHDVDQLRALPCGADVQGARPPLVG